MNILKKLFSSSKVANGSSGLEYVLVGLGNPGIEYKNTRHNAGFMAIDYISDFLGVDLLTNKFKGSYAKCELSGKKILLLKPQTYMNLSGESVYEVLSFYKIPSEKIIVLLDDISLPVGKIRIRKSGSHGGQNGMRNIIERCGTDKFPRIKIGIGQKPTPQWDLADWVLSKFTESDKEGIDSAIKNVKSAVELIIKGNIDKAMNNYN